MSDLYRTTDKANMWDGQKLESMVRDGVLVKVEPTDSFCAVHSKLTPMDWDTCFEGDQYEEKCKMVDVVRIEVSDV